MDVLVNRVDVDFFFDSISKDFDFYKIGTDLSGKSNFGKVVNAIYTYTSPLSLCCLGNGGYAIVLPKNKKHSLNDPHYTINQIAPERLPKTSCIKLLIGALPHLVDVHSRSSEGVGLYYLSDVEVVNGVEVLRTYEIKISWEDGEHLVLSVDAATFTPLSYHKNKDGEIYGDCKHLPKIAFDRWSQELKRSKGGDYIKKKHRDKNMKSEVVSLDTKNPAKFWRTKMGVLATFMNDVKLYLGRYISINFQQLSPTYRLKFKESDVAHSYLLINNKLRERNINIINLTDFDLSPLLDALDESGFSISLSNAAEADSLNLAIHHNKDYYDTYSLEDPYKQLRVNGAIVQSVYPETIIEGGKLSRPEYEACMKELFIKMEVHDARLHLFVPDGNWLFVVCYKSSNNETLFKVLTLECGAMKYELLSMSDAQDRFLLDLYRPMVDGEHAVVSLDSGSSFIFEETNYVALPQYQELASVMSELTDGYLHGIKREWVSEYLSLLNAGGVNVSNPQLIEKKLSTLLLSNPHLDIFHKKELFEDKSNVLSYKGSLQDFFDWVVVEKGLRLGASLKAKNSGYIEASLGLFYSDEERLYFVGDKDNVKSIPRFCRMRKILTEANEVPISLLRMMPVFHVRHKQATVLPFPFKHLREFSMRNLE